MKVLTCECSEGEKNAGVVQLPQQSVGVDIWIEIMNKTEKNAVFIFFFLEKKSIRKEKTFMVGVYLKLSYVKIMFLCVTR